MQNTTHDPIQEAAHILSKMKFTRARKAEFQSPTGNTARRLSFSRAFHADEIHPSALQRPVPVHPIAPGGVKPIEAIVLTVATPAFILK
jgi:hypothetical protein